MRGFRLNLWRPRAVHFLLSLVLVFAGALAIGLPALASGLDGGLEKPGMAVTPARRLPRVSKSSLGKNSNGPWRKTRGPMALSSGSRMARATLRVSAVFLPATWLTDDSWRSPTAQLLDTLGSPSLEIRIAAPSSAASFQLGIFDGDADVANDNWDLGSAPFTYSLIADPDRDGSGSTVVAGPFTALDMVNNGWFDFNVITSPAAAAPSGNFFYRLVIENTDLSSTVINSFKLRTDGVASIEVPEQPFGFYAALQSVSDAGIIYPALPDADADHFRWHVLLPVGRQNRRTGFCRLGWRPGPRFLRSDESGYGRSGHTQCSFPSPLGDRSGPFPEGVAVGNGGSTGAPQDDRDPAGNGIFLQKMPAVFYEIEDANGVIYNNNNPSGNQEWEQFRITTDPADPVPFDAVATELPAGTYVARARGSGYAEPQFLALLPPGALH